jgi:hypothetical protein
MTIVTASAPKRRHYPKRKPQPAIPSAIVAPGPMRKRLKGPVVRIGQEQPAEAERPRIVTARPKPGRFGPVQDLDAEEHQRRGDAAEALFRELVRRARSRLNQHD